MQLHRIDPKPWGHEVELYTRAAAVMAQFIQQQYYCETPDGTIGPEPNDVVLDAVRSPAYGLIIVLALQAAIQRLDFTPQVGDAFSILYMLTLNKFKSLFLQLEVPQVIKNLIGASVIAVSLFIFSKSKTFSK